MPGEQLMADMGTDACEAGLLSARNLAPKIHRLAHEKGGLVASLFDRRVPLRKLTGRPVNTEDAGQHAHVAQ